MRDREFWQLVYLQAIENGKTPSEATTRANNAVTVSRNF